MDTVLLMEAKREGYKAYHDELGFSDNPYSTDDDQFELHMAWNEGFAQAGWDD